MNTVEVLDTDLRHFVAEAHGLGPAVFYVIAHLDTPDGATRWMPRRAIHPDRTRSMYLPEATDGGDYAHVPEAKLAYAGPVEQILGPNSCKLAAPDGSSRLEVYADAMSWVEDELLEVSGTPVGPTFRLRVSDPEFPMLYTTRPFSLTGTVKSNEVQGSAKFVAMHMPQGRDLIDCPLLRRLQISWVEFTNEHDDGSFESGLLVSGREGLAALAVDRLDGPPVAVDTVDVRVENDGGDPEFPLQIEYSGGGQILTWASLRHGGRWPAREDIPDGYRFCQGVVRREGAGRVVRSQAFAETFQARMTP